MRTSVAAIALEEATEAALDALPDSHLLRRQIQQNEDLRAALNAAISEQARTQQAFAHASPDDMPRAEADNDRASAEAQNIKAQLAQGTKASEDLEKKARAQFRERREEELIDEHAASPAGKAIEAMSQLLTQNFAATAYFNAHRDRDHPSHDDPTPPRSASKSHGTGPTYIPRIFERGLHAEETKGRKLTLDRCSHDTEKWRLLNYLAIQHDSVRDIVEVIRTNNMATIHAKISSDPGLGDLYDAADRFVAKAIHICLDHDEHNYRVASFLLHLERQHNYADIHNSGMMLMPEIDQFCQAKILADYHADQERYDKTTYFTLGDEVDKSIVQMERLRREYVRSHPEESKTPGATIAALLKKMPKGDSILSRIVNDRQSSLARLQLQGLPIYSDPNLVEANLLRELARAISRASSTSTRSASVSTITAHDDDDDSGDDDDVHLDCLALTCEEVDEVCQHLEACAVGVKEGDVCWSCGKTAGEDGHPVGKCKTTCSTCKYSHCPGNRGEKCASTWRPRITPSTKIKNAVGKNLPKGMVKQLVNFAESQSSKTNTKQGGRHGKRG